MTLNELKDMIVNLDIDDIPKAVQSKIDAGIDPKEIIGALSKGMDEVGDLYEKEEYYLAELVLAGETMKDALNILEPHLKPGDMGTEKKVICATVKGDNHDIGKNILKIFLLAAGFNVIDLGMDCPAKKIVESVKNDGAQVVALSSLLTMTIEQIKIVHEELKKEGLRDKVKIIVGGAPLNMEVAKKLGADDFADDAVVGVKNIALLFEEFF